MSLDIVLLKSDGSVDEQLSIGVEDHYRLTQLIGVTDGLMGRISDYYEDAKFENYELDELAVEAVKLSKLCFNDRKLSSFMEKFLRLIEIAKAKNEILMAVAD